MSDLTTQADASPARDVAAALDCAGGDQDLADELLRTLLEGLPAELEQLRASMVSSNWAGVAEKAHHVRGATRYCAVTALDQAIEALERAARLGNPLPIRAALAAVETQAQRLATSIET